MKYDLPSEGNEKPFAGTCQHSWQDQEGPYFKAQFCVSCKLYRYKVRPQADWEYRAPIPIAKRSPTE